MHPHAVFASLHRGTPLAAAVPSGDPQRLAWVGVYPLDLSRPMSTEFLRNQGLNIFPSTGLAYHVRSFEVDRTLIDADSSVSEADLRNQRSTFAFSDDELMRQLESLGAKVESLELPCKTDYPI